jgi:hypothetical protein
MGEIFSQVVVWIGTALGGISLAGIITAILYGCLKGAFNKTISKINVQKIADEATEKGIEKVKKVSFTHSIQPLVESKLEQINEKATEVVEKHTKLLDAKFDNVILILERLSAYFDNSIGVSEQAKAELKRAIAVAKNDKVETAECVVVDEVKSAKVEKQDTKNHTKVER